MVCVFLLPSDSLGFFFKLVNFGLFFSPSPKVKSTVTETQRSSPAAAVELQLQMPIQTRPLKPMSEFERVFFLGT